MDRIEERFAKIKWRYAGGDDHALDELQAGVPCRNCGRPFFGGPEWVAVMHRTPEQAAAIDAEEAEFRELHPDCNAMRWSISGSGIHHCARCCAPPPLPEEAYRRVAEIPVRAERERHASSSG